MATKRPDINITFEYKDETIHLVPQHKWTIGEARAAARWIGLPFEDMSQFDQMVSAVGISIKRAHPDFRLQDTDDIPLQTIADLIEQAQKAQEAAKSVPTDAVEEVAKTA